MDEHRNRVNPTATTSNLYYAMLSLAGPLCTAAGDHSGTTKETDPEPPKLWHPMERQGKDDLPIDPASGGGSDRISRSSAGA